MVTKTQLETLWNVPDELWASIAPVPGPEKAAGTVGRPSPQAVWACIHRARPVQQMGAIRGVFPSVATSADRLRQSCGYRLEVASPRRRDHQGALGRRRHRPKPCRQEKTRDQAQCVDGPAGCPLSIVVTAANTHDKTIVLETLDGIVVERPEKRMYRLHHLSLDKGYDDDDGVAGVLKRDSILYAGGSSNAPTPGTTDSADDSSVGKRRSPTISRWFNWPPLSVSSVYQRCTHDLFLYRFLLRRAMESWLPIVLLPCVKSIVEPMASLLRPTDFCPNSCIESPRQRVEG